MSLAPQGRSGSIVAALLGPFLLAGCAYFNTFYFAKKHFAAAERIREQAEETTPSGTTEAALVPQDALRRYDDAILQCKKVLNYHAGSRWADDALFLLGASYYGKAAYDSALTTLDSFIQAFPESEFVPRAQYVRGLSLHERGKYEDMEAAFGEALRLDPDLPERAGVLFTVARTAERQGDRDEAIRQYRALVEAFPEGEEGEDGLLEIGRLYFEAGLYDSALVAYSDLAAATKNEDRYRTAQLQIGESLVRLGQSAEAIERLRSQIPPEDPTARNRDDYPARLRLGLAQAYNREGRPLEAIATLREVVDVYKTSPYAHEAQYQIAYTYESYLDSLDAAEAAYEEAAKMNFRPAFRDLAKNRVIDLRKLRALAKQEGASDDADEEERAHAALQIAELFYYSKRDVASALAQYDKVRTDYAGTKVAPRAAYAASWIALQEEDLPDEEAHGALRELVAAYPASPQARAAIALLVSVDADTSGLEALLVEPEPEPEAVAPDPSAADSVATPLVPGLDEGEHFEGMEGVDVDSLRRARGALWDSLRVGRGTGEDLPGRHFSRLDSIPEASVDSSGAGPQGVAADSLTPPGRIGAPLDSVARALTDQPADSTALAPADSAGSPRWGGALEP